MLTRLDAFQVIEDVIYFIAVLTKSPLLKRE